MHKGNRMNQILRRILCGTLSAVLVFTCVDTSALAAENKTIMEAAEQSVLSDDESAEYTDAEESADSEESTKQQVDYESATSGEALDESTGADVESEDEENSEDSDESTENPEEGSLIDDDVDSSICDEVTEAEEDSMALLEDDENPFGGGSGTEQDPYLISTESQWRAMEEYSLYERWYKLTCDMTLRNWTPVGCTKGHFDGGGHTIHNLRIRNVSGYQGTALFESITTLKNLTIDNAEIYEGSFGGGTRSASIAVFVCFLKDSMENCKLKGDVLLVPNEDTGLFGVGGFCTFGPEIKNCDNYASITVEDGTGEETSFKFGVFAQQATRAQNLINRPGSEVICDGTVGGICYQVSEAKNCKNYADITTNKISYMSNYDRSACGISTRSDSIINCHNYGNIEAAGRYAAGIALDCKEIKKCSNEGAVTMTSSLEELNNATLSSEAAGIVHCAGTIIENCYNLGAVTGRDVGGIVNKFSIDEGELHISSCYNKGELIGTAEWGNAGGIITDISAGSFDDITVVIENCYNNGKFSFPNSKYIWCGGIVAHLYDTLTVIRNCYNNVSVTDYAFGKNCCAGIVGNYATNGDKDVLSVEDCYCLDKGYSFERSDDPRIDGSIAERAAEVFKDVKKCTDAELRRQDTYEGFEFGSIWLMGEDDYPYPIIIGVGGSFDGYEITLVPNGGSVSSSTVYTNKYGKLSPLPRAKDSSRRFLGWCLTNDGDELIDGDYVFSGDTTIYARWGVYDESKKVSISSEKPYKGEGGVAFLNISALSGSTESLDIEFETDHHVSAVNMDTESLKIYEYDDEGHLVLGPVYTLRNKNAKITFSDKKGSAGQSIVKIHLGSSSGIGKSMRFNTRYSIEIDKDLLVFDDPENYTFVDPGVWNFTTGVVTRYNEEEEAKANVNLPYWFDASTLDFSISSLDYDWNMAVFAYMTTLSAFETADATDAIDRNIKKADYKGAENARTFLIDRMGFEDFEYNTGYRDAPTDHSIGVCAASKKMNLNGEDYTVIILPIRGAGYSSEWASNARVGSGENHAGFDEASDQVLEFLDEYIIEKNITGKVKILVTGYSRAAGTTNLVAAKLDNMIRGSQGTISSATFSRKDIYGYCFEPPATTKYSDRHNAFTYGNIYCFINQRDLVPMVPTEIWGFGRFGKEYYYKNIDFTWEGNRGSHAEVLNLYKKFSGKELTITGMFVNNRQVDVSEWTSYAINGIAGVIGFPNFLKIQPVLEEVLKDGLGTPMGSAVKDRFYDLVSDLAFEYNITEADPVFSVISAFLFVLSHPEEVIDADFRAELSATQLLFFLDIYDLRYGATDDTYIQNKVIPYYRQKRIITSMIDTMSGYKIGQEHSPLLNFAWLVFYKDSGFSNVGAAYKKVYVKCPVDVEVYDEEGRLAATIINDEATVIDNSESRIVDIVAYVDADEQKIIKYPAERNYSIKITATGSGTMDFSEEYYAIGEGVTRRLDYLDIPIEVGTQISGTEDASGDLVVVKEGEAFTPETYTELVKFNVTLAAEGEGYVTGSGEYTQHDYVVARAISYPEGEFDGWYNGNELVSKDTEHRFRVDSDVELTARFNESEGIRVALAEEQQYSGYALKPEILLYDGAQQLIQGTDYTVSYKNNKNAFVFENEDELTDAQKKKAPQAIIKMKGNYAGQRTVFFAIDPLSVENEAAFAASLKKGKKPTVTFKYNGKALKENTDYKVDNLLENSVVITGIGNFSGTHEFSFASIEGITNVLMSKAVVEAIPAQTYTGTALTAGSLKAKDGVTPYEIKVSYPKGTLLTPGKDYVVSQIINATKAGTATVVIKGLKADGEEGANSSYSFTGEKRVTVKINQCPINAAAITGTDGTENLSAIFNKAGAKPEGLAVTINGNVLKAGRDYTVKYSGNTSFVGTGDESTRQGKLTITGKGNYKGSKSVSFKITKRPFTKEAGVIVTATDIPQAAKAGKYTTTVKVYDSEGKLLKAGTDYEKNIVYTLDGVNALDKTSFPQAGDVVTVKVTGKGGYCADVYSTTFRILESGASNDISKAKITIDSFAYNRGTIVLTGDNASHVKATIGKAKTPLAFSTDGTTGDFCVVPGSYVGNDKKGTAKVTFIGINGFSGTKTVSFKIGTRSLAEWWKGLFR